MISFYIHQSLGNNARRLTSAHFALSEQSFSSLFGQQSELKLLLNIKSPGFSWRQPGLLSLAQDASFQSNWVPLTLSLHPARLPLHSLYLAPNIWVPALCQISTTVPAIIASTLSWSLHVWLHFSGPETQKGATLSKIWPSTRGNLSPRDTADTTKETHEC